MIEILINNCVLANLIFATLVAVWAIIHYGYCRVFMKVVLTMLLVMLLALSTVIHVFYNPSDKAIGAITTPAGFSMEDELLGRTLYTAEPKMYEIAGVKEFKMTKEESNQLEILNVYIQTDGTLIDDAQLRTLGEEVVHTFAECASVLSSGFYAMPTDVYTDTVLDRYNVFVFLDESYVGVKEQYKNEISWM